MATLHVKRPWLALQPLTLACAAAAASFPRPTALQTPLPPFSALSHSQSPQARSNTPRQVQRAPSPACASPARSSPCCSTQVKRTPPAAAATDDLQRPFTLALRSAMLATSSSSNSPAMPDPQDGSQDAQTCFLDVVDLVLQHSDLLRGVRHFCGLLQTHTAVATAAAQHCRGRLELALGNINRPEQAAAAAPWLARHGQGVASLSMAYMSDGCGPEAAARAAAAGQAVARALQQAATQQPGSTAAQAAAGLLQLRSLDLRVAPCSSSGLAAACWKQLSSLALTLVDPHDKPAMARVAAAVAALPGLQQLRVGFSTDAIVSALSSSSSLTCLDARCLQDVFLLQCVPSQLQSLTVGWLGRISTAAGLQLQHCTALSKLAFLQVWRPQAGVPLASRDTLPASLQELELQRPTTLQPLAALTRLRTLSIRYPPAAVELRRLTCLSNLTHISLFYGKARPAASSAAWPLLPGLRNLELVFVPPYNEYVSSMAHLAKATNLTRLQLWFCRQDDDGVEDAGGAVAALAAAPPALTNLQDVDVPDRNTRETPHPDLVAGWPSLLAAINGLPRLNPDVRAACERFDQELRKDFDLGQAEE